MPAPAPATPYSVSPLDHSHDRAGFSCGSAALDRYLQRQARQDADKRVAAPFVLTAPPAARVLLPLQQQPRRLFLPMKTVAGLFGEEQMEAP